MSKKQFRNRLGMLAAILLLLASLPAAGENDAVVGITTANLRLREDASLKGAVQLTIPRGKTVSVFSRVGDFYRVSYNGHNGYASVDYITAVGLTDESPAPTNGKYEPITASSDETAIRALQNALKELGFYTSSVDGKYGSGTKRAVESFCSKNSLPASQGADAAFLQLLFDGMPKNSKGKAVKVYTLPPISEVLLSKNCRGDQVVRLQQRLRDLGYLSSSADGTFGSATENALKEFQKKMGLNVTGEADTTIQAILYSSQALSASAVPASTAVSDAPVYPFTTKALEAVNLRKGKTTSSTRYTTIPSGAQIQVLRTEDDYLYVTYRTYTGYVPARYVDVPVQYLSGTVLPSSLQARIDYSPIPGTNDEKAVTALQCALKELGFYTSSVDGIFGPDCLTAVKDFQKKNGLRPDGEVTPELQQFLFENKVKNKSGSSKNVSVLPPVDNWPMEQGDTGYQVKDLQTVLSSLGFYTGKITGEYDKATSNAVKAFQKKYSLTQDGKAGKKTLAVLNTLVPTPTPFQSVTPTPAPASTPLTPFNVVIVRNGTRGEAVRSLQEALSELGYYNSSASGVCTIEDVNAIRDFQKRNGLTVDGIAGYDTQKLLYSGNALPAATKAPTATPRAFTAAPATATPAAALLLKRGSTGQDVIRLQERLKELNYYSGTADGIFGAATEKAVETFQKQNGLSRDGQAGEKTLNKLYSSSAKSGPTPKPTATPTPAPTLLKLGSTGDEVVKMQKRLIELKYLASSADGSFGYKTYSALVSFQKTNKLGSDGIAGPTTLKRLYSSSAIAAPSGTLPVNTPTPQPSSGFVAPKASDVRFANWYTEIRERAKMMPDVVIYDPDTGLHYNLHLFSLGKHADAEPPTQEDTRIMYQVCGENSWTPHVVWVIFQDGRVYLASTHSHGHEVDHNSTNGLTGHICVHFPRVMSEAEQTGDYAVSHQKAILLGWETVERLTNR